MSLGYPTIQAADKTIHITYTDKEKYKVCRARTKINKYILPPKYLPRESRFLGFYYIGTYPVEE